MMLSICVQKTKQLFFKCWIIEKSVIVLDGFVDHFQPIEELNPTGTFDLQQIETKFRAKREMKDCKSSLRVHFLLHCKTR